VITTGSEALAGTHDFGEFFLGIELILARLLA
jgi:hypothetical protein